MGKVKILKGMPVLVVEDDQLQALDLAHSLMEAGALVIGPAADVSDANRIIQTRPCRATILDFRLGTADASPLAAELYRRRTPFVIHTAYDPSGIVSPDWTGCKLIPKPSDMANLIKTLAVLLRWQRLAEYRAREQGFGISPVERVADRSVQPFRG